MTTRRPPHANPDGDVRPWYKKKRFRVPLGFGAVLMAVGMLGEDPVIPDAAVADGRAAVVPTSPAAARPLAGAVDPVATASAAGQPAVTAAEVKRRARPKARAEARAEARAAARAEARARAKKQARARAAAKARRDRLAAARREQERRRAEEPRYGCNSNYSGCVPDVSDVDCAGGSGNGPAYLSGTARVIGRDVYDLDRDGDGIACDD